MDAEEHALLAAIISQPDEDTPRLVYADWLQEHDRPERAEYIRLSVQLANLQYGDPNFEADEQQLLRRRQRLTEQHSATWENAFAKQFPANRDVSFHYERGMVNGLYCSVKYFLDNGEKLFRLAPVRAYMPRGFTPTTAKRLVRSPLFRCLKELQIPQLKNATAILHCESVEIESLSFWQFLYFTHGEWDRFAVALAGHAGLKAVKQIDFENCGLGDEAGEALAASTRLEPDLLILLSNSFTEPVRKALRKRYGRRVWIDSADRNGFARGRS